MRGGCVWRAWGAGGPQWYAGFKEDARARDAHGPLRYLHNPLLVALWGAARSTHNPHPPTPRTPVCVGGA